MQRFQQRNFLMPKIKGKLPNSTGNLLGSKGNLLESSDPDPD